MSLRLEMPLTSDTMTSGTATSLSDRMKTVPHGLIQSATKRSHPAATATKPKAMPAAMPSRMVI